MLFSNMKKLHILQRAISNMKNVSLSNETKYFLLSNTKNITFSSIEMSHLLIRKA